MLYNYVSIKKCGVMIMREDSMECRVLSSMLRTAIINNDVNQAGQFACDLSNFSGDVVKRVLNMCTSYEHNDAYKMVAKSI